jgi:peptidoglycan-associated lipoprotein
MEIASMNLRPFRATLLSIACAAALLAGCASGVKLDKPSDVPVETRNATPSTDANAKALSADKSRHVTVEGHTDERGGREYNLALGQKRAEAVAKSLALLGAPASQVEAVSFGKERPAVEGHDEAAWAKNRRAELAYR